MKIEPFGQHEFSELSINLALNCMCFSLIKFNIYMWWSGIASSLYSLVTITLFLKTYEAKRKIPNKKQYLNFIANTINFRQCWLVICIATIDYRVYIDYTLSSLLSIVELFLVFFRIKINLLINSFYWNLFLRIFSSVFCYLLPQKCLS